jgi:hypothetical protein
MIVKLLGDRGEHKWDHFEKKFICGCFGHVIIKSCILHVVSFVLFKALFGAWNWCFGEELVMAGSVLNFVSSANQ